MIKIPESFKTYAVVARVAYHEKVTIGDYLIEDKFICNSLEDKVRDYNMDGKLGPGEDKIYGETAIPFTPQGYCYMARVENHRKFGICIRVFGVPHFEGILSHAGNTAKDTLGCVLAGERTTNGTIIRSKISLKKVTDKLLTKVKMGEKFPFFVKDKYKFQRDENNLIT